jgi:signal transduction histidine kinase
MRRNELKDVEAALNHDLNNTLQVVMGNLEVLRRRAAFVPEIVDAALAATRGAAHLADRMAAIARLRNVEARRLDLNAVLHDLADMMRSTLGDAIRLEIEPSPQAGAVLLDPRCLQTALLELAANARAAMPAGGRLTLRSSTGRLEVIDTGPGMPAEKIARAFDGGEPVALGLYLVEHCIRAGGGRVEITAAPSRGTTVTLYLPTP